MGKLLLEGRSRWMIATELEAAGFDTPAAHAYKNQGESHSTERKAPPSNQWNPTGVGKIRRPPATVGGRQAALPPRARASVTSAAWIGPAPGGFRVRARPCRTAGFSRPGTGTGAGPRGRRR
ncbi:hypothetical protein [Kitasatospora sp. NPDC088779]|uniref:hypothetical protein n=1 Tax=Kitasatospora sp. NPDC088779 TaxID=3154964 RepID=UPI0034493214